MSLWGSDLFAWLLVGLGLATLTEGYHAFRQRAERDGMPARYWWIAGTISAIGLGLIIGGLELERMS
jgi:hypothetical protein